ncbi:MAG: RloB family protein [Candidatus Krumholzibacteriia bacterium]
MGKRRKFDRKSQNRTYRKVFLIVTEGSETEPQYFTCFRDQVVPTIKIVDRKGDSAPERLLRAISKYVKKNGIRPGDEAWIVLDRDKWPEEQLRVLAAWAEDAECNHLAVSNPQFEYWLLLHFEDGNGVATQRECNTRLLRALPTFEKGRIECDKFCPTVRDAIERAKRRDQPPCTDWPTGPGTTVYRLVESMLDAE